MMSRASIRVKIMAGLLAMVATLGGLLTLTARDSVQRYILRQLDLRALSLARGIAAQSSDLVFAGDDFGLADLLLTSRNNSPDVRYIFVLGPNGDVLASTFGRTFPRGLAEANRVPPGAPAHIALIRTEEGVIHDAAALIPGTGTGTVRVGLSETAARAAANTTTARLLAAIAAIFAAGSVAAYGLIRALTQPLERLVETTRAFAAGDLERRAGRIAYDEIGVLAQAFDAMADNLQRLVGELQRKDAARTLLLKKVISAQEEERKRVARELHDETGQYLTSLAVGLRALEGLDDLDEVRQRAAELRRMVTTALEEVQYLSRMLRPSVLDDLGLVPALERYVSEFSAKFGVDVDLHVAGMENCRFSREIETALYRIVQEALTNVGRHARATSASVVLERRGDVAVAIVEDDGQGVDLERLCGPGGPAPDCCLGIFGMEERASLVGGALTIESRPGGGTSVVVKVPLPECCRKKTKDRKEGAAREQDPVAAG